MPPHSPNEGILFDIDGAKALRKAIRTVFGEAPVQRCVRHKKRNVLDHLPERVVAERTSQLRMPMMLGLVHGFGCTVCEHR